MNQSPEFSAGSSFAQEVQASRIEPINFEIDESTRSLLKNANALLLGEMHGVRENPDIIYSIMRRLGIRKLALEWNDVMEKVAENYLSDGALDERTLAHYNDGRVTAGHFALLKRLRDEVLLDELICFDRPPTGGDWQARDQAMAENILDRIDTAPLLVVAGNLHTLLQPTYLEDNGDEFHPMGELVRDIHPDIASIEIDYGSGEFVNLGIKSFDDDLVTRPIALTRDGASTFRFYLPRAHAAIVPQ